LRRGLLYTDRNNAFSFSRILHISVKSGADMKVKDLMTQKPACATPDMGLEKVARMMDEYKVGSIPVVENKDSMKVIGMITDRDIATRAVAKGKNPLQMKAMEIMTTPVVLAKSEDDAREVARLMEKHMIRRVPVVDDSGMLCGMVAQADIALKTSDQITADVVQSVSKPTQTSSKL
jgi:CBS domain-containing protein